MKNKFTIAFILIGLSLTISSCFTSRSKVGCPATAESGRRIKN